MCAIINAFLNESKPSQRRFTSFFLPLIQMAWKDYRVFVFVLLCIAIYKYAHTDINPLTNQSNLNLKESTRIDLSNSVFSRCDVMYGAEYIVCLPELIKFVQTEYDVTKITFLDLSHNRIELMDLVHVIKVVEVLPNLQVLSLVGNSFTSVLKFQNLIGCG